VWALSLSSIIQAILFFLFAGLTALVAAVIGPTYDNLLVPELAPGALYPSITLVAVAPANYLGAAARFSTFTVGAIVDPSIALIAVGIAVLYLFRSVVARVGPTVDGLLPRLVIAVVAANFTLPVAGLILSLGGSLYPVLAGWDGGAWQHWENLAGYGELAYSWDNGALAFVTAIVEFFLVFGLTIAIGVRDAVLAVLLVLLPIFTLLWPFGLLAPLARRAWLLFAELVFLPCVLIVPLELAVGSPSSVLLVGYLAAALGSPYLIGVAGTHLSAFGMPGSSGLVGVGAQRGLASASSGISGYVAPTASAGRSLGPIAPIAGGIARAAGTASAPAAAPIAFAQLVGHGGLHLVRHAVRPASSADGPGRWPPIRDGGSG